jgi:hypothetical protein
MASQCLIDNTNYIKTKNHSNHFLIYLDFLICCGPYFFWHKYILTSHHIRLKFVISLELNLFGFDLS